MHPTPLFGPSPYYCGSPQASPWQVAFWPVDVAIPVLFSRNEADIITRSAVDPHLARWTSGEYYCLTIGAVGRCQVVGCKGSFDLLLADEDSLDVKGGAVGTRNFMPNFVAG